MSDEEWDWFDEQAEADDGFDENLDDGVGVGDPRLEAGAEHLRAAAREVIAASRALLDVVEELVEDPHAARDIAGFVGSLGSMVGKGLGGPFAPAASGGADDSDDDPDDDDPSIQRIPIS